MPETNRTTQELLDDYAGALRDGCIPTFLKSLSREEGRRINSSREFWEGTEVVRILNSAGFAEKAVRPDVNLFISRVDAKIASRKKRARAPARARSVGNTESPSRTKRTERQL
jgi:hypothetical protein